MNTDAYQLLQQINSEITSPLQEQEKIWLDSFNASTNNLLQRLKQQFPELTNADCRLIMYIYLGFSNLDICMITNITKETIWRRRNRIKQHLGLSDSDNLDDWLRKNEGLRNKIRNAHFGKYSYLCSDF